MGIPLLGEGCRDACFLKHHTVRTNVTCRLSNLEHAPLGVKVVFAGLQARVGLVTIGKIDEASAKTSQHLDTSDGAILRNFIVDEGFVHAMVQVRDPHREPSFAIAIAIGALVAAFLAFAFRLASIQQATCQRSSSKARVWQFRI